MRRKQIVERAIPLITRMIHEKDGCPRVQLSNPPSFSIVLTDTSRYSVLSACRLVPMLPSSWKHTGPQSDART